MTTAAVFADASFYLALMRADDALHPTAATEAEIDRPVITTEFILLELGNACSRAPDHDDFLTLVEGMRARPLPDFDSNFRVSIYEPTVLF
ncbi:MAG: hypothetical protein AAB353_12395 [Candidatus Hydrogenedentota bacterium]